MEYNNTISNQDTMRPLAGFEFRYTINEKGDVYDTHKNKMLKKDDHSRFKLIGSNDKEYSISIGKLLSSTFEKYSDFGGYEIVKSEPNYLINRNGSLYSTKRKTFITTYVHSGGYVRYNANIKQRNVHRLMAEQFIENTNNSETVNHIDGNKLNNSLSNLEWATQKENNIHAHRMGLMPTSTIAIEFIDKLDRAFYLLGLDEVKKVFGINKSTISTMVKRYGGTGKFIPAGSMAGFKVNKVLCKVHRLSERSRAKLPEMVDIRNDEDIVKSLVEARGALPDTN